MSKVTDHFEPFQSFKSTSFAMNNMFWLFSGDNNIKQSNKKQTSIMEH